jgi:beta-N-acetylhexosaminidase
MESLELAALQTQNSASDPPSPGGGVETAPSPPAAPDLSHVATVQMPGVHTDAQPAPATPAALATSAEPATALSRGPAVVTQPARQRGAIYPPLPQAAELATISMPETATAAPVWPVTPSYTNGTNGYTSAGDAPPLTIPPAARRVTAPPPATRRPRGHRRLLMTFVLALLLALVAAVPLLHGLAPTGAPRTSVPTVPAATATATATVPPQSTPNLNLNVNAWVGAMHAYVEQQYVDWLISHMTLDEEIGQMIQVSFYGTTNPDTWVRDEIARDHIGSVILYDSNLTSAQSAKAWTSALQSSAKIPLLIGADVEGGLVNRLLAIDGYFPTARAMAEQPNPTQYTRQLGQRIASDLLALGLNNDYAPVVDVDNGGIPGDRMFSSSPSEVTKLAGAFLSGLQQSGQVVGTLKHFPGLGDVPVDPHAKLYVLNRSLSDLENIDWAPYKSLVAAGQVDMIMSTHVVIAAVDPTRPATLSHAVLTGILRDQLHFNGVIITDGLYMASLSSYSFAQRVLYMVQAGNDIISAAYSPAAADETLSVIRSAVLDGAVSKQQIDDSVRRILLLKLKYGVLTMPQK